MIIGTIGQRELAPQLRGLTDRIGREINPHIFTRDEYARRAGNRDHFLGDILAKRKLFLIGNEDEFECLACQRVDAPASD